MSKFFLFSILFLNAIHFSNAAKTVDYAISNLQLSASSEVEYAPLTFSLKVDNLGDTIVWGTVLHLYISKDTILNEGDKSIEFYDGPYNFSDYSYTYSNSIRVPQGFAAGQYYLLATVSYETIKDINMANNITHVPFTLKPSNIDLEVNDLFIPESPLFAGASTLLYSRIKNIGTTPAFYSTINIFLSSDDVLSIDDLKIAADDFQQANESATVSKKTTIVIPSSVKPAKMYIIVKATLGYQTEKFSQNNVKPIAVEIMASKADLIVGNLKIESTNPALGSKLSYSYKIKNQGLTMAQNVFAKSILIYSDDNSITVLAPSDIKYRLDADSVLTIQSNQFLPKNITSGNYTLKVIAQNSLHETDSSNNSMEVALNIVEQNVKINMSTPQLSSYSFPGGTRINVSIDISNAGATDLSYGKLVNFASKDTILDSTDVSILPFPSTFYYGLPVFDLKSQSTKGFTYQVYVDLPEGKYYFLSKMLLNQPSFPDKSIAVIGNNKTSFIVGQKKLDYSSTAVKSFPTEISMDTRYHFSYKLKNLGTSQPIYWTEEIYLSSDSLLDSGDKPLQTDPSYDHENIEFIKPNDSITIQNLEVYIPVVSSGTYYLLYNLIVADDQNLKNNTDFIKVKLSLSDTKLKAVDFQATFTSSKREGINIDYFLKNIGSKNSGYRGLYYYISADTLLSSDDGDAHWAQASPLNPGDAIRLEYEADLYQWSPQGKYYLFISEDPSYSSTRNFSNFIAWTEIKTSVLAGLINAEETDALSGIGLYPNPANTSVSIFAHDIGNFISGEIHNLQGETKLHFSCLENINIQNLTQGIYFVHVHTDQSVFSKKLVVK